MKLSRRLTLTTAIVALVLYASATVRSDEFQFPDRPAPGQAASESQVPPEPQDDTEWQMDIQPAVRLTNTPAGMNEVPSGAAEGSRVIRFDRAEYSRIYNSIPFNRAEYDANPNYRHDSTMEILTGNARHQTIVKHNFEHKQPVKRVPPPTRPSRILIPFNLPGLPFGSSFGYGFGLNALRY